LRPIKLQNNLTRKFESLKPIEDGHIKIYGCGVTPYDHSHIGHAMQAIFFDVIRRYLEFAGYRVTYVRNYTDVDDKIINRAQQTGISPRKLADDMMASTDEDMKAIGNLAPTHAPRVSETIPQIIAMTEDLIKNGAAYATKDGDVFYRVAKKEDYGKLSNTKVENLRTGTRDIAGGAKEDELDFALWKADTTPDASWDSPWGRGRPGWHIECSAMAKEFLGASFDIHGGGRDLIFPHHENEIAQSESANQAPFATCWLHNGLLTIEKQKMSKSLGNHLLIKDFLKDWPAEVLRTAIIQQHYASNIDFARDTFSQCLSRLVYYYRTLRELDTIARSGQSSSVPDSVVIEDFHKAMSEDFNTANALAEINKHFKRANELFKRRTAPAAIVAAGPLATALRQVGGVLGILQNDPVQFVETLKDRALKEVGMNRGQIEQFVKDRAAARANKDFAAADMIRKELSSKGIELMDGTDGTEWTVVPKD
jgi:cysteinyl-tRNA synthetase